MRRKASDYPTKLDGTITANDGYNDIHEWAERTKNERFDDGSGEKGR